MHTLAWNQLAASTRRSHISWLNAIKGMPDDISHAPLARAIVELVLRMADARKWKHTTISTAFSSIASALNALPLYSTAPSPINIRSDPYFNAASKRAQHLARITTTARKDDDDDAMTTTVFEQLRRDIKTPNTRILLELGWAFAARVGDLRQVRATDVRLTDCGRPHERRAAITFRYGKGAAFWGPYTIHAIISASLAKELSAIMAASARGEPLFSERTQRDLSAIVRKHGTGLRGIRKGSLQHLAAMGATDEHLQLLSGHKRRDTLLRYLGWGVLSSTAAQAADARAALAGAGCAPPIMGLHSGRSGFKGQRVEPPPRLFAKAAPSSQSLGIGTKKADTRSWPLHVKHVGLVDWHAIATMGADTPFAENLRLAQTWCESSKHYGSRTHPLRADQLPPSRWTPEQIATLMQFGKLEEFDGPIFGYVLGFALPQENKRRLRPIFEPGNNKTLNRDALPHLTYPSRLERRAKVRTARFVAEFDFAAYYDQFALATSVRCHFAMRVRERTFVITLDLIDLIPPRSIFAPRSGAKRISEKRRL